MLDKMVNLIVDCIKSGGKVLTFGVGGNAANAIHFAAELAGKYEKYETPLPCIDLVSNVSVLTAITNDFGWEHVFERQIQSLAKPGDVVMAFSISTDGEYLRNALLEAYDCKCSSILICGENTLPLNQPEWRWKVDCLWELGSLNTPKIQEKQLGIIHRLCLSVKSRMGG